MSTKLYHGWRIDTLPSMQVLLKRLQRFRAQVAEVADEFIREAVVNTCVRAIDWRRMYGKKFLIAGKENPFNPDKSLPLASYAKHYIDDKILESFNTDRRTSYDIQCSVTIHPIRHKGKMILLMLLFDNSVGHPYESFFGPTMKARPYPYWNNTDRPDDVTSSEWRLRGRLWDRALKCGIPAASGFTFECADKSGRPFALLLRTDELKIPIVDARRDGIADEYARSKRFGVLRARGGDISAPICYSDAVRWVRDTKAGQKALAAARVRAKKRVVRITTRDLMMPVSKFCMRAPHRDD